MNSCFELTIVTVCYNSEKTIARTIESVIVAAANVNCKIEYLIIDGASSDNTLKIIQGMICKAPQNLHARVFSEKDRGIYDAMNKGIREARGNIIGFLNSDDEYLPSAISLIMGLFKFDERTDVIHGDVIWRYGHSDSFEQCMYHAGEPNLRKIVSGMVINHPTLYCKREVYKRIGNFDSSLRFVADWKWSCNLFLSGCNFNIKYLPEPLVVFDMGGASSQAVFARYMEIAEVLLSNYRAGFSSPSILIFDLVKLLCESAFSLSYHMLFSLRCREHISKFRKRKFSLKVEK